MQSAICMSKIVKIRQEMRHWRQKQKPGSFRDDCQGTVEPGTNLSSGAHYKIVKP